LKATATGLPVFQVMVSTPRAPSCPSLDRKAPAQRVWVGDVWRQAKRPDRGPDSAPPLNLVVSVKEPPVKVPVTLECGPNEGNEPEYLVGISVAASTDAERTAQPADNATARNIIVCFLAPIRQNLIANNA
jgi:hypothetical protein